MRTTAAAPTRPVALAPALLDAEQVRAPWLLDVAGAELVVRGAAPRDLPAVALMHARCSPMTLLDRYHAGGRPPALAELERQVRDTLSFVAVTGTGRVVATARVAPDAEHVFGSGRVSVLVEDAWQRLGIGRALLGHAAAAAAVSGYRQLITYPGTSAPTVIRMLAAIGTTRWRTDSARHLHTALPATAPLALGPRLGRAVALRSSVSG